MLELMLALAFLAQEDAAEIRLYLIDKEKRPVELKDAAAGIVIEENGKGRTLAMELVNPRDSSEPAERTQVRELGPYFAEIAVTSSVRPSAKGLPPPARKPESVESLLSKLAPPPQTPPQEPPKPGSEQAEKERDAVREEANGDGPTLNEWIQQVHGKPYFRLRLKELPKKFTATITVRLGGESFTARGFAYPVQEAESPDLLFARIDERLKEILRQVEALDFRTVPLITGKILDDLDKLSGLSLPDPKGDREYARSWCVELARRMEKASRSGEEDIPTLVAQFNLKLKDLKRLSR